MTRLKQTSRFDSVVIIVENLQDLKLSDCLRYHMRDTNAAKDLLYRLANHYFQDKTLVILQTVEVLG